MVIPGGQYGTGLLELLVTWLSTELIPLGLENIQLPRVPVDVVADEQKHLWLLPHDRLPDRLRIVLLGTGAKRDP